MRILGASRSSMLQRSGPPDGAGSILFLLTRATGKVPFPESLSCPHSRAPGSEAPDEPRAPARGFVHVSFILAKDVPESAGGGQSAPDPWGGAYRRPFHGAGRPTTAR